MTIEQSDRKNCFNCEYGSYENAEDHDGMGHGGWVCERQMWWGKQETEMLKRMSKEKYRMKSKRCFMPIGWHGTSYREKLPRRGK